MSKFLKRGAVENYKPDFVIELSALNGKHLKNIQYFII